MSIETLAWLRAGHIFGFMMWVGTLIGSCHILKAHAQAGQDINNAFADLEKSLSIVMDVGATLTIGFGLCLIFLPAGGTAIFKSGGFFHVKLLLIAFLIGSHVLLKRRHRQFRNGEIKPIPSWLFPAINVAVLVIIIMIMTRPF